MPKTEADEATAKDLATFIAWEAAARAMLAALEAVAAMTDEAVRLGTMSGSTASRILIPVSHAIDDAKAAGIGEG